MKTDTRNAYVEVLSIINLLEDEQRNKIPKQLKEFFENNKNQEYQANIVPNIPLEEQNLLQETVDILAMLKLNYWSTNEKEKDKLRILLNENEKNYQEELKEKYNYDRLFKKNAVATENVAAMVEYKESIFTKIKNFFKRIAIILGLSVLGRVQKAKIRHFGTGQKNDLTS